MLGVRSSCDSLGRLNTRPSQAGTQSPFPSPKGKARGTRPARRDNLYGLLSGRPVLALPQTLPAQTAGVPIIPVGVPRKSAGTSRRAAPHPTTWGRRGRWVARGR